MTEPLFDIKPVSVTVEPEYRLNNGLIRQRARDGDRHSLALFSPDWAHRLLLMREWPACGDGRLLTVVMLNPSTADALADDATIRRVCGYARREGCSGVQVLNLFTWRSASPQALLIRARQEAVDPRADEVLADALSQLGARLVLVAWGQWAAHPNLAGRRDQVVRQLDYLTGGETLWCLGTTKSGEPVHPLRQRSDAPLREWLPL